MMVGDIKIKAVVVGDSGVGKTSFVQTCKKGKPMEDMSATIGVDLFRESTNHYRLELWDTAGQERFRTMVPNAFRGVDLVFLFFSVEDAESFKSLDFWLGEIKKYADDPVIILVGNKSDRDAVISNGEIGAFYNSRKLPYFESSVKYPLYSRKVLDLGIYEALRRKGNVSMALGFKLTDITEEPGTCCTAYKRKKDDKKASRRLW